MCDFLLVINTNLLPILHRFRDIAFDTSKIATFGYPSTFNPPRGRGDLHHIIVNDISLKTRSLGLHFCRRKFRNIFNHFYAVRPNATDFAEITQNNGQSNTAFKVIQGHRFWYQSKVDMRLPISD